MRVALIVAVLATTGVVTCAPRESKTEVTKYTVERSAPDEFGVVCYTTY